MLTSRSWLHVAISRTWKAVISIRRRCLTLALLAAALLMTVVIPTADARMPRARAYHAGRAITLDTNLLSVSGASAWAIDEYLKAKTSLPMHTDSARRHLAQGARSRDDAALQPRIELGGKVAEFGRGREG